jgi:hypothetical protein
MVEHIELVSQAALSNLPHHSLRGLDILALASLVATAEQDHDRFCRGGDLRTETILLKQFKLFLPVQSSRQKDIDSLPSQITCISPAVSSHRGAVRDRHGRGTGCGGRGWRQRRRRLRRTAKTRGPDAPTLASSWWKRFRRRWWQQSPVTKESAEETVKTIARGMPGVSGVTVVTCLRAFYFCTQGCGRVERPAFPAPSWSSAAPSDR